MTQVPMTRAHMTPLYRRVLGPAFDTLSPQVKALHDLSGPSVWTGGADVERGTNPLSRLAGWLTSLPPAGRDVPLVVAFEPSGDGEIWNRRFGNAVFRTTQFARGGQLCERAGPTTFGFAVDLEDGAMCLKLRGLRVLGIPVPALLHPVVATREWQDAEGVYRFTVESRLPILGLLVHYKGWLRPA